MDNSRIIEKARQSLNFVEQLQNQIQLCREALSNPEVPLTPRVQALESLLWAKLRNDIKYQKRMKELNEWLESKKGGNNKAFPYMREKAQEQFKAIMIFIDEKDLMPIGEQNE